MKNFCVSAAPYHPGDPVHRLFIWKQLDFFIPISAGLGSATSDRKLRIC